MVAVAAWSRAAAAQDIEVPILVEDRAAETDFGGDEELDLANFVFAAAKATTTVQEAPAIVTVLVADELDDFGARNVIELLDGVPGWLRFSAFFHELKSTFTRGTTQGMLLLHNGVSLFDPMLNYSVATRIIPIETLKRIEVVTGPGGLLWGANSYMGVVNLVSKDAEDVDGVEAAVGFGSGRGDLTALRGYVLLGVPKIGSDAIQLFAHASFDSFEGAQYRKPYLLLDSPQPQPRSQAFYGPMVDSNPPRSFMFNFDGTLTAGPLKLSRSYPIAAEQHPLHCL